MSCRDFRTCGQNITDPSWIKKSVVFKQPLCFKICMLSLLLKLSTSWDNSFSSIGATARCGLWPVEKYLSTFPYLSSTLSIFSRPVLEDFFLLLLSIISWVFFFVSSLPVFEYRSFWAPYAPSFSPGDPANVSFAPLSILLFFIPRQLATQNPASVSLGEILRKISFLESHACLAQIKCNEYSQNNRM